MAVDIVADSNETNDCLNETLNIYNIHTYIHMYVQEYGLQMWEWWYLVTGKDEYEHDYERLQEIKML